MAFDKEKFNDCLAQFTVSKEELNTIAANFRQDLKIGLKNPDDSSLRMLKSYVGLPTGKETGEYLAMDFGGTNVRILKIRLDGDGKYEIVKKVGKPLRVEGEYDYIGVGSKAKDMFDLFAGLIDEAIDGDHETKYLLGHTFSFPSKQTNLYNARLIIWTKEFATEGVEGEVVNDLLKDALKRKGITNVEPTAVINDTVAVLLSAAYKKGSTYIGSIYATGHNTCYLEPYADSDEQPMILNLESGNFSKLAPNRYDKILDDASERPGEQRLEKMVSGRYMGEILGVVLADLWGTDKKYKFTSIDMSAIIEDGSDFKETARIVEEKAGVKADAETCGQVQTLVKAILNRSARLVTATFVGIVWQLTGNGKTKPQHIAVDGSVYEKMPGAKESIDQALKELLGEDAKIVDTVLDNGGSGLGAAIAAAMSK
jgi:hexokinase